jgi:hypothetical protein
MLDDNRAGKLMIPRDLNIKSDLFIYDKEKKTFSPNLSASSKEIINSLVEYTLTRDDITAKIEEIMPVMKTVINENPRGFVERARFGEKFREKGIVLNTPRDIPRIFGFFYLNNFYFSSKAFTTAFKLLGTK